MVSARVSEMSDKEYEEAESNNKIFSCRGCGLKFHTDDECIVYHGDCFWCCDCGRSSKCSERIDE